MRAIAIAVVFSVAGLLTAGCPAPVAVKLKEIDLSSRTAPAAPPAFEFVENPVSKCVAEAIRDAAPRIELVSPQVHRAALADGGPRDAAAAAGVPAANRISHIVLVDGLASREKAKRLGGCSRFGCALAAKEEKESELSATVFDLEGGSRPRTLSATASGTGVTIALWAIPIIFKPYTEARACSEIGAKIAADLASRPGAPPARIVVTWR